MSALANHCHAALDALEARSQRRALRGPAAGDVISFAANDYLGLSRHQGVVKAGQAALAEYGAGAGASRLVTGNHPLYPPLEAKLARMKHKEAALVFGSGYLTNLGVIPALVGKGDLILADKLVHACIVDGAQLSGAICKRFIHNDVTHAESLLREHRTKHKNTLIVVDHVYSMDGDVAPLAALSTLAKSYDAWLMADDAHGLGIVHSEVDVDIWMGTLSKAVGCYGGYVAASKPVIDYLTTSARSFIFSTGLPPSVCASALAALEIMEREPQHGARAVALARRIKPDARSAIVPIILKSEEKALAAAEALKKHGIHIIAIRPPAVPSGTSRLRLAFSSAHTDEEVDRLIDALKAERLLP